MTQNSLNSNKMRKNWSINKDHYKAEFCKILARMGAIQFGIAKIKTRESPPYFVNLSPLRIGPRRWGACTRILKI